MFRLVCRAFSRGSAAARQWMDFLRLWSHVRSYPQTISLYSAHVQLLQSLSQELLAGLGGTQENFYGVMGQEHMAGCALYFWGLRWVRGFIKINMFNSTEWDNKLKLCWNPILGFYNPQKLINFRDLGRKVSFPLHPQNRENLEHFYGAF